MTNLILFFDRYSIFVFLIICFQYFHAVSLNSFRLEFFIQLIPYLLLSDIFIFPLRISKLFKRRFLSLSIFIGFCFLSLLWTDNLKYTLASNLELFLTSITILIIVSYLEKNNSGIENITKFSLLAIYLLIFIGLFSFDYKRRTFFGMSPSLSSSVFNYGSVCSLFLFTKSNKKFYLLSFISFFILNFATSSLRGIFAPLLGLLAYSKQFNSKKNYKFFLKILLGFLLLSIFYIFLILNIDFRTYYPDYTSDNNFISDRSFRFIHQFLKNSLYLKFALKDIFINQNFEFQNYKYAGERFSAIFIGIKETFLNSPLIGFGHGNSRNIFEPYGKLTYSHNGVVEIFIGTGIIGLFFYLKFIFTQILKPIKSHNYDLTKWKRFSSLVFLVHLLVGLPFENIPLSLILSLIIVV